MTFESQTVIYSKISNWIHWRYAFKWHIYSDILPIQTLTRYP